MEKKKGEAAEAGKLQTCSDAIIALVERSVKL